MFQASSELSGPAWTSTTKPGATPERKHWRHCDKMQKWGKSRGDKARLATNLHKSAVATLLLENVHSLNKKTDNIKLWRASQPKMRNCYVSVFTESWLNMTIREATIELEGLTLHRGDRVASLAGNRRGKAYGARMLWCSLVTACHNL